MSCESALDRLKMGLEALPKSIQRLNIVITLEEIARLAGVSRSTVSRVANGRAGVRLATREHVLRLIREYGYQPNAEARSLAAQRFQKHP
jgi:transcriptional regulator with XRE-family HTH domain